MSTVRQTLMWVVAVLAGATVASAAVALLRGQPQSEPAAPTRSSTKSAKKTRVGVDDRARRRRLRPTRIAEREDETEVSDSVATNPVGLDPRDRKAQLLADWAAELDKHRTSTVDAAWAGEAEASVENDLRGLGEDLFELVDVDCRTSSCLATLNFSSFSEATQTVGHLLQHPYESNCATKTIMPAPEDPTEGYAADLLFECG